MRCRPSTAGITCLVLLLVWACGSHDGAGRPDRPAQGPASFDLSAARDTIARKNAEFTSAHVAGDVATIDAMFTRDAKSFPPGAEAAIGPAALHMGTVEYLKAGVKAFSERTTDLYGNSDLLVDQGEYEVTYGPDNTVERGKYLNVWKQEDGTWKIHANIWNASPASTAPR
jgi:ketosteroid isomerase-like protein